MSKKTDEKKPDQVEDSPDLTTVEAILRLVIDGAGGSDIKEYLKVKGLTEKEAAKRLDKALDDLQKTAKVEQDLTLAWCLEAMREVYRKMLTVGDYPAASKAIIHIATLAGVFPGKKQPLLEGDPGGSSEDSALGALGKLSAVK